jgi:hypothetical protein
MKHHITAPIHLLDRGQTVADLHQVLVFLQFAIVEQKVQPNYLEN